MKKLLLFLSLLIASISFSQAQCPIIYYSLDRTITNDSIVNIKITIDSQIYVGGQAGMGLLLVVNPLGTYDYVEELDSPSFITGAIVGDTILFHLDNIGSFTVQPRWITINSGTYVEVFTSCSQVDTFTYPVPYLYPVDTVPVDTVPVDTIHSSIQEINNYNTKIYSFNNDLYINSYDYLITNYQIINMLGQIVDDKNVMLNGVNKIQTNISEGNYVVICTLSNGNKISKHINIINK